MVTRESAIAVNAEDMSNGTLPKNSWVRYDKLFTLSSDIITKIYGTLLEELHLLIIECLCDYIGCNALKGQNVKRDEEGHFAPQNKDIPFSATSSGH